MMMMMMMISTVGMIISRECWNERVMMKGRVMMKMNGDETRWE